MLIYDYPAEIWDAATCEKKAKHLAKDGMGTKYPFRGYIGSSASVPAAYGVTRYNGGTVIDGAWYDGINRPLPTLATGFEIVVVPSWGWRIVKISR